MMIGAICVEGCGLGVTSMNDLMAARMVVDTSALVAVAKREDCYGTIADALLNYSGILVAPALVEFGLVTSLAGNLPDPAADKLIARLIEEGLRIVPFDGAAAEAAIRANPNHGKGNGTGGKLNMLDLMVYGVAKVTGLPILCTGKDFAATDALIHPASRID